MIRRPAREEVRSSPLAGKPMKGAANLAAPLEVCAPEGLPAKPLSCHAGGVEWAGDAPGL